MSCHHVLNNFLFVYIALILNCFITKCVKLIIHEFRRSKVSVSFIIISKRMLFQNFNPHTCTFDILMPVGLHCFIMQMQVTRIYIQLTIVPVSSSLSICEPPYFSEDPFLLLSVLIVVHYDIVVFVKTSIFVLEAAQIDNQMLVL